MILALLSVTAAANAKKAPASQQALREIIRTCAPDSREAVTEVTVSGGKVPVLSGAVSEAEIKDRILMRAFERGIRVVDSIRVLPDDRWAQVRISVANMRTKPGHASEMASQLIMGTPVRVLESNGSWWRVQGPDGYIAYVIDNSLVPKTTDEIKNWKNDASRAVVTSRYQVRAYATPTTDNPREVVTDLVNGSIVSTGAVVEGRTHVVLPDGRVGWVDSGALTPISEWASQEFDADHILDMAYSMEGQPYLWGGTSTKSLDCSGLSKVSYLSNGIILMRDASQQATTGQRIEPSDALRDCRAGDLLFFGNPDTGRVTHVAIYDHDGHYVHSSGRVKRNSIDPTDPTYLSTPFLHAVRIHGNEGTRGITRAKDHPWYF